MKGVVPLIGGGLVRRDDVGNVGIGLIGGDDMQWTILRTPEQDPAGKGRVIVVGFDDGTG